MSEEPCSIYCDACDNENRLRCYLYHIFAQLKRIADTLEKLVENKNDSVLKINPEKGEFISLTADPEALELTDKLNNKKH